MIVERAMGIEPMFESWETCAASRGHKSAIRQSEKQGPRESREAVLGGWGRVSQESEPFWLQL